MLGFVLMVVPLQAEALFFEIVYASSDMQIEQQDPANLTGRQAREYRERLQQQYDAQASSSSQGFTKEEPVSEDVEVKHYYDQQHSSTSSSSKVMQTTSEAIQSSSVFSSVLYSPPPPSSKQQGQDKLTLEQIEAYANEAEANMDEQMEKLRDGFSVTSTSSLGSPLTVAQREAILRRDVRTTDQLKLFTRALTESNDSIRQISVDDTGVMMSLRRKVHLFGFLPLNTISKVSVDIDGTVTVDLPWWTVLARTGADADKQDLQQKVMRIEDQSVLRQLQEMMQVAANR